MIPIQLTIQGLYSYQEKQTIDFTQLTAANLFGIFGSVGCGKSSILEAITFALYGKTDRLNLSGDNRNYNMMNLKSDELLIEFIFETGKAQTAYRATVAGKRNSKNFEDVKKLDRKAYKKIDNQWSPIDTDALEQAIGLSYENFKRTIIIPQGQFQEFLQLGNKDRTQMMKELFNLAKYEFFYKVTALESKNNAAKQNIEGQLQQLGAIDLEQVGLYKTQLAELEKELVSFNQALAKQQQFEKELQNIQQLTLKKTQIEKEYNLLLNQQEKHKKLENKIARYEEAQIKFKHQLDSLHTTNEKHESRGKQIKFDTTKLKEEQANIEKLTKLLDKIKPAYENREDLKKRANELTLLLQMKALSKTILEEEDRLTKGAQVCNETIKQFDKSKIEKQELEEKIKKTKKLLPDISLLSKIKTWFVEKNNLDKQLNETDKELVNYEADIKKLKGDLFKIQLHSIFKDLPKAADFADTMQYLNNYSMQIKVQQNKLIKEENHIPVKAQVKEYSKNLEDGKACPLCGSLDHPEMYKADEINEVLSRLEKNKQHLDKELEQLSTLVNQINQIENQSQLIIKQKQLVAEKKKAKQKQNEEHNKLFVWDKYKEEKKLNSAFRDADEVQKELKVLEKHQEEIAKRLDLEEKNKERFQTAVDKIKTSLTVHNTELKTISKQLKSIDTESYNETSASKIEEEKVGLLNEFARLEKEFNEKNTQLTEQTKAHNTLSGSLLANQNEWEQEKLTIAELNKQVQEQLQASSFDTLNEIKQLLAEPFDSKREKQKITQYNESLVRHKSQLDEIQKEIGNQVYDSEVHQKLQAQLLELKQLIDQKNQEQGKVSELLKKLEKDIENQSKLLKEKEQLDLRAENIKTMKGLFKASGFVNYISSVYLQNLCNAANDRFFQLTKQKLSLEITEDNNFLVRDFMNGGKTRNVKTLSGGQTFQAALSLALALADNIQKITESNQNFFFLDEGFGSLDKESLSIVFDTLKSLRKEKRIVGVISHVEEMQQEIEVHLRIKNDQEKGSRISTSWES
ncbi:MAG: AAA family ATPase [Prolixibacteraceae bacterium]|jgi:exonuclease SbcC|nr:AAA family ATPase [Prolixibacteraceae bacterium]